MLRKTLAVGGLLAGSFVLVAASHRTPTVSAAVPSHAFAGELKKGFEAMSAADFVSFASHLPFTGGAERGRMCSGTPECDAGTARTSGHVEAVDQNPISSSNIPTDGVIISRFENTGKFTERRYGLAAGAVAYLIALPSDDSTTTGRWVLAEVDGGSKRILASGHVGSCGHGAYPGKPQADFRSCASASAAHSEGMTANSASFRTGDNDPIWISCETGCCTAGFP
jgi:hypothetical protein